MRRAAGCKQFRTRTVELLLGLPRRRKGYIKLAQVELQGGCINMSYTVAGFERAELLVLSAAKRIDEYRGRFENGKRAVRKGRRASRKSIDTFGAIARPSPAWSIARPRGPITRAVARAINATAAGPTAGAIHGAIGGAPRCGAYRRMSRACIEIRPATACGAD